MEKFTEENLEETIQAPEGHKSVFSFESFGLEKQNELADYVRTLPDNELNNFWSALVEYPDRHLLSQDTIDVFVERGMRYLEESGADFSDVVTMENSMQLHGDFRRGNPEDESITDKAYRASIGLYKKYPTAGHELQNIFGQNHTVRPDIVVDSLIKSYETPYLFEDIFQSFIYLHAFGSEAYGKSLIAKLDFKDPAHFYETGLCIEMVARLYDVSSDTNFAEQNSGKLLNVLEQAVQENSGSYFLNLRAKQLAEILSVGGKTRGISVSHGESNFRAKSSLTESENKDIDYLESSGVQELLSDDLGIALQDYSPRERAQFLNFTKNKLAKDIPAIKSFLKSYRENGFRTFLSLEQGRDLGGDIIMLGEKIPPEDAQKLFAKYAEIVGGISDVENLIPEGKNKGQLVNEAEDNLLKRGRKILEGFATAQEIALRENTVLDTTELMEKLSSISKDNQVLLSVFKAAQKDNPGITFEQFKDVQFAEESVNELDTDDILRLREIYAANYESLPQLQKRLLDSFDSILENSQQKMHVIRHKDLVVGFYLYTEETDGSLDFRCFNMDSAYAGGGLGKGMMNSELSLRAKEHVIHASCIAQLPISSEYIESGFVAVGYGQTDEVNILDIVRKDKNNLFTTKEWSTNDIDNVVVEGGSFDGGRVLVFVEQDVSDLPFDLAGKAENGEVHVLTRYIRPQQKNGKTILVFEKVSEKELDDYKKQ